ncbi:hypothetical protein [Streptomyces gobiensis]|uniref:hypothetical protein n=1 Tax=Streptomyces gobiensis TaxID=2875706 RepID=UPI001E343DF2|nr:hypothetical protein [Streptomyces gobiensis]UGY93010.1 hypothetical protein test1122_15685 [Streptomyces gobiensis]
MHKKWKPITATIVSLGFAVTGVVCAAGPSVAESAESTAMGHATAKTVTVDYNCRSRYEGEWFPVTYTKDFTTSAPATVRKGQMYNVTFDPSPIKALPEFNKMLTDLTVAYKVPKEARVLGYRLTGGSNLGDARVRVQRTGNEFTITSDGKFRGGTEFDLPNLVVKLQASAPRGTRLTTGAGGSSFERPQFGWLRQHPENSQWDPFQCYEKPEAPQTFSTTTVR